MKDYDCLLILVERTLDEDGLGFTDTDFKEVEQCPAIPRKGEEVHFYETVQEEVEGNQVAKPICHEFMVREVITEIQSSVMPFKPPRYVYRLIVERK